jgi:hypothetical protein
MIKIRSLIKKIIILIINCFKKAWKKNLEYFLKEKLLIIILKFTQYKK